MVYTGTAGQQDETLLYMLQPEGLVAQEGAWTYKYFKTDHVGSTRMVFKVVSDGSGGWTFQEAQSTDYYPFGLAWSYDSPNENKYLFGGKELQDAEVGDNSLFGMTHALLGGTLQPTPCCLRKLQK